MREREYGLTISKRASRDAIDCLVALAMAVEWAASIEPPRQSVYEQRFRDDPDSPVLVVS